MKLKEFLEPKRDAGEMIARGDACRDKRDWSGAAQFYRTALNIDPRLAHIWVQLGHALKETQQYRQAEEAYNKAAGLEDAADTHLQLGHLYKVMGRHRQAETHYLRALEQQPNLSDARNELSRMGWSGARMRRLLSKTAGAAPHATSTAIAFELSDLIDHLHRTRYPTGIQRVQLALGEAFTQSSDDNFYFVYYDHHHSDFFEVQRQHILDIVELVERSDRNDLARQLIIDRVRNEIVEAPPFEFSDGSFLVNVGTSWGFLNYFMRLREIKRRHNVRYVPLVHDCIPILYPEFCNPNLVCDFINWMSHMLKHADLVLTNSENTRRDVLKVAQELNVTSPPIVVTRLNGEYGGGATYAGDNHEALEVLSENNLDLSDFVLFVSTIEPRKNHTLALSAWSRMLKSRAPASVPFLVCVGNSGWMNEAFYQRLERDPLLRSRVVVLHNVSEQVLQALYERCLFTIFPSLYEGWGLPISEALAHGKVPLVSRVSSHTEAGGALAVYFDVSSEADFQANVERLIDDPAQREQLEGQIRASSSLRAWSEIARDILGAVEQCAKEVRQRPAPDAPALEPVITCGRYYSFSRNTASSLQDLMYSGDDYRAGVSWHSPEPEGCWIRGRSADIAFNLASEEGKEFVAYLQWEGSPTIANEVRLSLAGSQWIKDVSIESGKTRWDMIPITLGGNSKENVRIRLSAKEIVDFSLISDGVDRRIASVRIKGLYVARKTDANQRLAILEAIQFDSWDGLASRQ